MYGRNGVRRAQHRIRLVAWVAVLSAALLAVSAPGIHADEPEAIHVLVRLHVARTIAPRVLLAPLEEEVEGLWGPYGVHLEWSDADAADAAASGFSVDAMVEHSFLSPWTTILGRATVGPVTTKKPIHVSFDATERVLISRQAASPHQIIRDHDMARALGRVLAHELGHVLLAARSHERDGLMRANFIATDLAAPDRALFRLTPFDVALLRGRVHAINGDAPGF